MLYVGPGTSVLYKTWEKAGEGSVTVGVNRHVWPRATESGEKHGRDRLLEPLEEVQPSNALILDV